MTRVPSHIPREGTAFALHEARERETALRGILEVISRSRADEMPVFNAILENAAKLCGAPMASLNIVNDARTHLTIVAHWGMPLKHFKAGSSQVPLDSANLAARAIKERKIFHRPDLADDDLYRQGDPRGSQWSTRREGGVC